MKSRELNIAITAGEPSGDFLGGAIMQELNANNRCQFVGVGGQLMKNQGLDSWFDMADLSVMGATDVIKSLPRLLSRIKLCAQKIIEDPSLDVLIVIDAQDFSKRVAKKVRKHRPDLPIILYVAPTVWVWRPKRARKMKPYIDHILSLFPHEVNWFEKLNGPRCTYVGHPLTQIIQPVSQPQDHKSNPTLLCMPGSRKGELDRHLGIMKAILLKLNSKGLEPEISLPTLPRFEDRLRNETRDWPGKITITTLPEQKDEAFQKADAALVVVGTATLELGLAGVPMVIFYQPDWLMRCLTFLFTTKYFGLPNVILDKMVSTEYFASAIDCQKMADDVELLLTKKQVNLNQRENLQQLRQFMLLNNSQLPAEKAAQTIIAQLKIST